VGVNDSSPQADPQLVDWFGLRVGGCLKIIRGMTVP